MTDEIRVARSEERFPVQQARNGKCAVQIKAPDGSVLAVLLPKDATPEGAQELSDLLESKVGMLVTRGHE